MRYRPERHHRHSTRIKGYDYSQPGSYFITLCAHNRDCWFGKVIDGTIQLSPMGKVASDCWWQIPRHFPNVVLDEFVVMPNHLHGIITIAHNPVRTDPGRGLITGRGLINQTPTTTNDENSNDEWILMRNPKRILGKIIRHYKASASKLIRGGGHFHFQWQRNYYEHIIRNEIDLNKIRQYIVENPVKWSEDAENPERER